MLKLELVILDERWPLVSILINRTSKDGNSSTQETVQYDLAHDKAQVMLNNGLRVMINEIVARRKQNRTYMTGQ